MRMCPVAAGSCGKKEKRNRKAGQSINALKACRKIRTIMVRTSCRFYKPRASIHCFTVSFEAAAPGEAAATVAYRSPSVILQFRRSRSKCSFERTYRDNVSERERRALAMQKHVTSPDVKIS